MQEIVDRIDRALSEAGKEDAAFRVFADDDSLTLLVGRFGGDEQIAKSLIIDLAGSVVRVRV